MALFITLNRLNNRGFWSLLCSLLPPPPLSPSFNFLRTNFVLMLIESMISLNRWFRAIIRKKKDTTRKQKLESVWKFRIFPGYHQVWGLFYVLHKQIVSVYWDLSVSSCCSSMITDFWRNPMMPSPLFWLFFLGGLVLEPFDP